ncbi:MAG: excinuclease ABC subunit UvrB [Candidatus Andersenbacteria bacterium]
MPKFELTTDKKFAGDQPQAIAKLVDGLEQGYKHQTLVGVTGSGKTMTMAGVIQQIQKPTLVLAHNKTLAAQLASEFKQLFSKNAVQYFVSYYDYYQPEAYVPRTDTYIAKDSSINDEIDRLRHQATVSLLTRRDVIIVASVSCIYGLGDPEEYGKGRITLHVGKAYPRRALLQKLVEIQYARNEYDFKRASFRVRGDVLEIYPSYEDNVLRLSFFGEELEKVTKIDGLTGEVLEKLDEVVIFPATHWATERSRVDAVLPLIERDMGIRVAELKAAGKLVEAQRLQERTTYDLEMLKESGYINGIENYSRYFDGRAPGSPPSVLLDYFPKDFVTFVDESHITLPQVSGMERGDFARKKILVDYGFRLPAAVDNRPLNFKEFNERIGPVVYVSATPREYELHKSEQKVEQLIRPTYLLDPTIEVKPTRHQIDDLVTQIKARVAKQQRVIVTTLTKRLAEELTEYLRELRIKVQYLHSEVDTLERLEILRDLRLGVYDVVVGINLLREGLDLPEVSLVAILDADKEGYLRDDTALIQTMGRAARHLEGHVIMYADKQTGSMRRAMLETERRRTIQAEYNKKHKTKPVSISKAVSEDRLAGAKKEVAEVPQVRHDLSAVEREGLIKLLTEKMELAAKNLEFEEAAEIRDQVSALREQKSKRAPTRT